MKKLLAIVLCLALMLPVLALAEGDGRVHITYSFWGNQTEAEAVQKSLDEYNQSQDKVFVEPMQIPNEEYTQTLVNYAIANNLPDCGMVNENAVLYFSRNGVMADVSDMFAGEELQPMDCITFKDSGVPVGYSSSNEILILYYNKDMFDAANEPYPSADTPYTWDEFVAVAKRLTFDENGNLIPCACNECNYMRLNTMQKLYDCLKNETNEIVVDPEIARKAIGCIDRMLELSK